VVSRLSKTGSRHWLTGTSAPCLSVLKPVPLGGEHVDTGPAPRASGFDGESLFWRSERLHRVVLRDYERRRAVFEVERTALETRALATATATGATDVWREHRERTNEWRARASRVVAKRRAWPFDLYWKVQSFRDGVPT
jgi:hypothetical protein